MPRKGSGRKIRAQGAATPNKDSVQESSHPRCQELGEVDPRIAVHAQSGCNGRWVAGVAPTLPTAPRRSAGLGLGLGFGISSVKFDPSQDVKQLHHSTVHDRVLLLHLSRYRQSGRNEGSTTFTSSATDAPRKALQY